MNWKQSDMMVAASMLLFAGLTQALPQDRLDLSADKIVADLDSEKTTESDIIPEYVRAELQSADGQHRKQVSVENTNEKANQADSRNVRHSRHKRDGDGDLVLGDINRQHLEQPEIGCPIQITSNFVKSGYLSVRARRQGPRDVTLSRQRRSNNTYFYMAEKEDYSPATADMFTLLTHRGMTGYPINNRTQRTPRPSAMVQRLVRVDSVLVAKLADASMASKLVLKRWPPICSRHREHKIYDPPTHVQIMIKEDPQDSRYKGALLNVDVRPDGKEELNFITASERGYTSFESECVPHHRDDGTTPRARSKPSVIPSTLFMVTYLPCPEV